MTIASELRRLHYLGALVLVVLAIVVLAARIVGLVVVLVVDGIERAERTLSARLGVTPLGGSMVILPADVAPGGVR